MDYKYVINKNRVIIALGTVVILIACILGIYMYNADKVVKEWNDKIFTSITVNNVDVGGMTKDEAKKAIEEKYKEIISNKEIKIKYLDNEEKILKFKDLNPKYDTDKALDKAFKEGKEASLLKKYKFIKNGVNKNLQIEYTYDDEKINELIGSVASQVKQDPVNAKLNLTTDFEITPGQIGQSLDEDKLKKDLSKALKNIGEKDVIIKAKTKKEEPKVKEDDLKAVNKLIGSFSTNFSTSAWGRAQNVKIGASKLNGALVIPGEEFSFNNFVGEASQANGYQLAIEYYGNDQREAYGGGICQVSTTLYNALIKAGLMMTERNNHTQPVSYVNPSADAMISYGSSDLKFINTYDFPIYIQAFAPNRTITVNVYSAESMKPDNVEYKLTYSVISDTSVARVSQGYRQKIVDGQVVETTTLKRDTYTKQQPKKEEKKEETQTQDTDKNNQQDTDNTSDQSTDSASDDGSQSQDNEDSGQTGV